MNLSRRPSSGSPAQHFNRCISLQVSGDQLNHNVMSGMTKVRLFTRLVDLHGMEISLFRVTPQFPVPATKATVGA
jgi:hypothetical protein